MTNDQCFQHGCCCRTGSKSLTAHRKSSDMIKRTNSTSFYDLKFSQCICSSASLDSILIALSIVQQTNSSLFAHVRNNTQLTFLQGYSGPVGIRRLCKKLCRFMTEIIKITRRSAPNRRAFTTF